MIHSFEDAGRFGKEMMDTGLQSAAALSKGAQAIAAETAEYTKKSFEAGSSAMEQLLGARSLDKAVEVQTDFARKAYESFIAEASRMGELYADLAKDAYKPFESVVAKMK